MAENRSVKHAISASGPGVRALRAKFQEKCSNAPPGTDKTVIIETSPQTHIRKEKVHEKDNPWEASDSQQIETSGSILKPQRAQPPVTSNNNESVASYEPQTESMAAAKSLPIQLTDDTEPKTPPVVIGNEFDHGAQEQLRSIEETGIASHSDNLQEFQKLQHSSFDVDLATDKQTQGTTPSWSDRVEEVRSANSNGTVDTRNDNQTNQPNSQNQASPNKSSICTRQEYLDDTTTYRSRTPESVQRNQPKTGSFNDQNASKQGSSFRIPEISEGLLLLLEENAKPVSFAPFRFKPPRSTVNLAHSGQYSSVELPTDNKKRWKVIFETLVCLRDDLNRGRPFDMEHTMQKYYPNSRAECNFGILRNSKIQADLQRTLPIIIEHALMLTDLIHKSMPLLDCKSNKTIYLTRTLCCSLLANAFFCTFTPPGPNLPDFNFIRLYNDTNTPRCAVKTEKLRCLLNYFCQFQNLSPGNKHQIVSYERRHNAKYPVQWNNSGKRICAVKVNTRGKIEESTGSLECDFANKVIGGGVLNDGSVMEEIRFCISPELLVSRLFTENMNDNEVVVITGSVVYSQHRGYSTTFEYSGPEPRLGLGEVDMLGRSPCQVVAIDALEFKKHQIGLQFNLDKIERELHKCMVAFKRNYENDTVVATGNWGCGAFNGDKELKFLIQLLAASEAERTEMIYFVAGDSKQANDIEDVMKILATKNVGEIFGILESFDRNKGGSLFAYIGRRGQRGQYPNLSYSNQGGSSKYQRTYSQPGTRQSKPGSLRQNNNGASGGERYRRTDNS